MFRTTTIGTHNVLKHSSQFIAGMRIGPTYKCTKCGQSHSKLRHFRKSDSCRDYLLKQHRHRNVSPHNPARQRYLKKLDFNELFGDCHDPIDFLTRRSESVDTTHGTTPQDWAELAE